jgi:hypothetical protein
LSFDIASYNGCDDVFEWLVPGRINIMDKSADGVFLGRSGHHRAAKRHWFILGKRCIQLLDEKVRREGAQVLLDKVKLTFEEGFCVGSLCVCHGFAGWLLT